MRLWMYVLGIIIFASCANLQKAFDSRNYDTVITQFLKKKKTTDEEISLFVKSYHAVLDRDKSKITTLKSLNNGEKWEEIFELYTTIQDRQNKILRVLPIYYSNGEKAIIETFDLSAALEESRQNSAQYYYDQGIKLLNSSSKSSIRQSLDYFNASKKFYINYKDVNELIAEAQYKGKNFVLLLVDKNPALLIPPAFEQSILDNITLNQNDSWLHIDYRQNNQLKYDYVINLNLYDIQISPDAIKEKTSREEKTIEDGWQYVLDNRGNVKKDSLGNDIKVPKYKKIYCDIREIRMNKTAKVFGDATIYDAQSKSYIKSQKCTGNAAFDYTYYQYEGDRNALSSATQQMLNNPPALFPNTFDMVERSKEELIRCYKDFISNNYAALTYTR